MSFSAHLSAFLTDPKNVSALTPTSRFALRRVASKVDRDRARLIVEYGPGSGVLTERLLERLQPEGRLIAIELNATLAARLPKVISDSRLTVINGSAEEVRPHLHQLGLSSADYILSGMPFFWLPTEVAGKLVAATHDALAPDGRFIAYQMFFQGRRYLRDHLEKNFRSVTTEFELRNLPPYRIYEAVKEAPETVTGSDR